MASKAIDEHCNQCRIDKADEYVYGKQPNPCGCKCHQSKAIDELEAIAIQVAENAYFVPLSQAKRIIAAQEQRIAELKAELAARDVERAELIAQVEGLIAERDEWRLAANKAHHSQSPR